MTPRRRSAHNEWAINARVRYGLSLVWQKSASAGPLRVTLPLQKQTNETLQAIGTFEVMEYGRRSRIRAAAQLSRLFVFRKQE